MQTTADRHAEPGRAIGPETARPNPEELTALAFEFWKARGCPAWLWGGLPGRRPFAGADRHGRPAPPVSE